MSSGMMVARRVRKTGEIPQSEPKLTSNRKRIKLSCSASFGCLLLPSPAGRSGGGSCSMAKPVEQSEKSVVTVLTKLANGASLGEDEVLFLAKACFPPSLAQRYGARRIAEERLPDEYQTVHDLWIWFLQRKGWEPILNSLRTLEPAVHEPRAISYARTMFQNELGRILGRNTVNHSLSKTVRSALTPPDFIRLEGGRGSASAYGLASRNRRLRPDLNLESLCDHLPRMRATGRARQGLPVVLPAQKQIRSLMLDVFDLCGSALTLDQVIAIVRTVFDIPVEVEPPADFAPSPISDCKAEWVEAVTLEVIDRVERVDGVSLEPAASDPKAGKLGKLLVDFMLWRAAPLRNSPRKTYGLESYSQLTGVSVSTLEDWLKKELSDALLPLKPLSDSERLQVWAQLRVKFKHRLPEIVDSSYFSF